MLLMKMSKYIVILSVFCLAAFAQGGSKGRGVWAGADGSCLAPVVSGVGLFEARKIEYNLEERTILGVGGTSRTFLVPAVLVNPDGGRVNKDVVFKQISLSRRMISQGRKRIREQFYQEILAMRILGKDPVASRYVPELYEWQEDAESEDLFISMEYLPGFSSVSGFEFGGITPKSVMLVEEIARAIKAVHNAGIIHHDICPENIMYRFVDGKPEVKIIDFGNSGFKGKPTFAIGHLGFIAREVIPDYYYDHPDNGHLNDEKIDVFSFGALASEIFFKHVVYKNSAMNAFEALDNEKQVLNEKLIEDNLGIALNKKAGTYANRAVLERLAQVLKFMVALRPEQRCSNMGSALELVTSTARALLVVEGQLEVSA